MANKPFSGIRTAMGYLRGVKSGQYRTRIRNEARRLGFDFGHMNDANRQVLRDAIFTVENELESTVGEYEPGKGGATVAKRRQWVKQMREARNIVLDDMGINEDATRTATGV